MKVKVFAKLNLCLDVVGKLENYHSLDSIVTSIDIFDEVEVCKRCDNIVTVSGMSIVSEDNIAYKTAVAFMQLFNTSGVDIKINKGIPFGAGLGGSSADSAAVIWCMCKLFNIAEHVKIERLCASLGSDIYFMLQGGLARMQGKGEKLTFAKQVPIYFAVTKFDYVSSTADVFKAYDNMRSHVGNVNVDAIWQKIAKGDVDIFNNTMANKLEAAVKKINNYAEKYLEFCASKKYSPSMTGSGSSYFIPFVSIEKAQNVCTHLNQAGFTTVMCKSESNGIVEI